MEEITMKRASGAAIATLISVARNSSVAMAVDVDGESSIETQHPISEEKS
jgi:hypothetical protein